MKYRKPPNIRPGLIQFQRHFLKKCIFVTRQIQLLLLLNQFWKDPWQIRMILKQFNRVYPKSIFFGNSIYGGLIFGGSYTRGVLYSEVYGITSIKWEDYSSIIGKQDGSIIWTHENGEIMNSISEELNVFIAELRNIFFCSD